MIAAIETRAYGCRFRSRLEARWATFFECCGIAWRYEPEAFRLSDGSNYLPDFYLPDNRVWVEVKGNPDEVSAAWPKAIDVASGTGAIGAIVLGDVPLLGLPTKYWCTSLGGVDWIEWAPGVNKIHRDMWQAFLGDVEIHEAIANTAEHANFIISDYSDRVSSGFAAARSFRAVEV